MIEGEMTVRDPDSSTEYERAVALQATIAAIMFVGEGIAFRIWDKEAIGPSLELCVKRAKELVEMVENSV